MAYLSSPYGKTDSPSIKLSCWDAVDGINKESSPCPYHKRINGYGSAFLEHVAKKQLCYKRTQVTSKYCISKFMKQKPKMTWLQHKKNWNCWSIECRPCLFKHNMLRTKCLPIPPARNDSWNTEASTTTPIPSAGGKMNPKSRRTRPNEKPAKGPAVATFRRSSRLGTIFKILVMAPKEPICHQNNSLDIQYAFDVNKTAPLQAFARNRDLTATTTASCWVIMRPIFRTNCSGHNSWK